MVTCSRRRVSGLTVVSRRRLARGAVWAKSGQRIPVPLARVGRSTDLCLLRSEGERLWVELADQPRLDGNGDGQRLVGL